MVALLMRCKGPAAIDDWVISSVCLLPGQHCPKSILGCISLQQKWFGIVGKGQNRSCHTHLLQSSESIQGIL